MTTPDLLLHPVRLRIVQRFLGDRSLTTADLRAELPDVPVASLYRHVARLVDGGVLEVVAERQVRGAVERTYTLARGVVEPQAMRALSREEHRAAFLTFLGSLAADFDRYLSQPAIDPLTDRIGYRQVGLHLTDDEVDEVVAQLGAVLAPYLGRTPSPGSRLRILSTVLLPGDAPPGATADPSRSGG